MIELTVEIHNNDICRLNISLAKLYSCKILACTDLNILICYKTFDGVPKIKSVYQSQKTAITLEYQVNSYRFSLFPNQNTFSVVPVRSFSCLSRYYKCSIGLSQLPTIRYKNHLVGEQMHTLTSKTNSFFVMDQIWMFKAQVCPPANVFFCYVIARGPMAYFSMLRTHNVVAQYKRRI